VSVKPTQQEKVKRLVTAAAFAASLLAPVAAHAASADGPASDYGYATAALTICPGLTVTDPKLQAKLDKKYRNTVDFKSGYDWVAQRKASLRDGDDNQVDLISCLNPIVTEAKWLHQDPAGLAILQAKLDRDRATSTPNFSASAKATHLANVKVYAEVCSRP